MSLKLILPDDEYSTLLRKMMSTNELSWELLEREDIAWEVLEPLFLKVQSRYEAYRKKFFNSVQESTIGINYENRRSFRTK